MFLRIESNLMAKRLFLLQKAFICEWTTRPALTIEAGDTYKLKPVFGS
jgi:hypothetical protein